MHGAFQRFCLIPDPLDPLLIQLLGYWLSRTSSRWNYSVLIVSLKFAKIRFWILWSTFQFALILWALTYIGYWFSGFVIVVLGESSWRVHPTVLDSALFQICSSSCSFFLNFSRAWRVLGAEDLWDVQGTNWRTAGDGFRTHQQGLQDVSGVEALGIASEIVICQWMQG